MLENQESNKFKSNKGYHAVPPPFTGNSILFKPDLTFMDEIVKSKNMDVTTIVTPSNVKTVESNHESIGVKSNGDVVDPKTVRKNSFRPPVIEDWNFDDDSEGNPQQKEYKEKGVIDSGCSRHMTRNKCYLIEYEDYDGGFVSFGDGKCRISGKGKIKTGTLDFNNVYFCKELKYNLFSVSQICDKKNNVLFTDTECLVLSSDFKLLDESQVLLRKEKQHKASYKTKLVNSISKPLHMLHMDLFGPTNVKSLMKKSYCLVVTDDFSRFSWVFFLATKDETSGILKTFITEIENQLDHKVKVIRCDNGTEFKNSVMNQFCEMKGIKREFSVARTPQQNGVAERRNRTLIEAARTICCRKSTNGIVGTKDNIVTGQAEKKIELEQEYILIPICTTDPLISQDPKVSKEDDEEKPTEMDKSGASDKDGEDDQATRSDTSVSAAGPSFTNDDLSSPVNATEASNAFEEHLFE
ncbi:putative ribonuclease H-like domain-containing protein [Tanacetum coccineum]